MIAASRTFRYTRTGTGTVHRYRPHARAGGGLDTLMVFRRRGCWAGGLLRHATPKRFQMFWIAMQISQARTHDTDTHTPTHQHTHTNTVNARALVWRRHFQCVATSSGQLIQMKCDGCCSILAALQIAISLLTAHAHRQPYGNMNDLISNLGHTRSDRIHYVRAGLRCRVCVCVCSGRSRINTHTLLYTDGGGA